MSLSKTTPKRSVGFPWVLKFVVIATAGLYIIQHLSTLSTPAAAQTHKINLAKILANIQRDILGEPIGVPTLQPNTTHLHRGSKAMVASDVPLCSQMGVTILQNGGNAADAAVTVALCIGSINSHSSGIGGGALITSLHQGDVLSIDAREMAPAKADKDMYQNREIMSKFGGLAIAVPGELQGLYDLYVNHGSGNLTWYQLFEPVIELNRNGFKVGNVFARILQNTKIYWEKFASTALLDTWDFIFKDGNELVEEGDIISRPNFADTLELIAKNGSSRIFYDPQGPIVPRLVKEIQRCGGFIEAKDFEAYRTHLEPALNFSFNSKTLYTSAGISSGLSLIAGLNFFSNLNNSKDPVIHNHQIIESMKWMASVRSNLGDFSKNLTHHQELYNKFSSSNWGMQTALKYNENQTFSYEHYEPKYELTEPHGTSHFSVVDQDDNAVAMTTTINLLFGSLVYDNVTGIILNNEMDDFSVPSSPNAFNLTPSVFNYISPGARPLSSTSPSIVIDRNGKPELIIGAAGGSRITTAIFHAIVRIFYEKLPLLQTIAGPRFHHQLIPEFLIAENFTVMDEQYNGGVIEGLKLKNHTFWESGALTTMNAIHRVKSLHGEVWEGVSDFWRKRGEAAGF